MRTYDNLFGIDVSKETFDVFDNHDNHFVFNNNDRGFVKFKKIIPANSLCTMEVTGIYHLRLAKYLFNKDIDVSVVNPLRIKRFNQMHLKRNKTDKADAKMICLYSQNTKNELWEPAPEIIEYCQDLYQLLEQYIVMRGSLKNKLNGLKSKDAEPFLIKNLNQQISKMTDNIKELEVKLNSLIKEYNYDLFSNLKSIKGIGEKTAALLIITTQGFKGFENAKQVISYYGLAPTEYSSGTSIKGKSSISKMGNPLIRKKLYMCSIQAKRCNKSCALLYNRIISKGKPSRVALVAVMNKLIKQAFSISKSGLPYDNNYKPVNPML